MFIQLYAIKAANDDNFEPLFQVRTRTPNGRRYCSTPMSRQETIETIVTLRAGGVPCYPAPAGRICVDPKEVIYVSNPRRK
jgi:hypothetical protein